MSELLKEFKQYLRENEESYKNGARNSIEYPLGYEEVKLLLNEIERLNNIINEFNKLIENEINESKLEDDYERVDSLEYCLATLKELKGDKSNENIKQ